MTSRQGRKIVNSQDDVWLSGQWYAGGIYAEEELVTTLSLSTFAAWQERLFAVLGSGNMKHFFISFKYFSNIHIFMNNSQDQMRCLWTTQEDIYIIQGRCFSFFFLIETRYFDSKKNHQSNNRNKIALLDFSQFRLSEVAFYLLQQTRYLVI